MDQRQEISFSLPKPHGLSRVNVGFREEDIKRDLVGVRNGSRSFGTPTSDVSARENAKNSSAFFILPSLSEGLDKGSLVEDVDSMGYTVEDSDGVEGTDGRPDVGPVVREKVRHLSDPLISSQRGEKRKRASDPSVAPWSAKVPRSQSPGAIAISHNKQPVDKFGLFVTSKLPKHLSSDNNSVCKYVLSSARVYASLWEFCPRLSVVDLRIPLDLAKKLSSDTRFHVTLLQQVFAALHGVLKVDTLLLPTFAATVFDTLKEVLVAFIEFHIPSIATLVLHVSSIPSVSSSQELEVMELLKNPHFKHLKNICAHGKGGSVLASKLKQLVKTSVEVSYCDTERCPFFSMEEEDDEDDDNHTADPKQLLESLNTTDSVTSIATPLHPLPIRPKLHFSRSFRSDCTYTKKSELSEDDLYASSLWHLEHLHESGCNGEGTTIAVIDSGIHYIHPAFKGKILHVRNFVPNELDDFDSIIDSDGHGSLCAGIAAGSSFRCPRDSSDKKSTTLMVPPGVAPKANLVICKVVGTKSGEAESSEIVGALKWLKELHQSGTNIDVISISLASSCFSKCEATLISELATIGVIIVCCASNEGRMRFQPISFPGRLGHVLCIGAHNYNGKPTSFSPVGRELDFLAPGSDVGGPGPGTSGPFAMDFASGTSFATPAVAGLVSLVLHRFRKMSKEHPKKYQIDNRPVSEHVNNCWIMRELIKEMSSSPGHHSEEIGHGTIDPYRLLDRNDAELYRLVDSLVED